MDLNLVRELIDVVSRSPIGELQIERDGFRVRIAKQASPSALQSEPLAQPAPAFGAPAASGAGPTVATIPRHSIRAPLTGVFYRAAG
jgi:acetyl-CoA carboxylase biotin carboxyl carrier protein